jgi:hypothetical protein
MKRITVLLADDNGVVRKEFKKILELEDDLDVVGEAKNGRQTVAMVNKLRPALVLMANRLSASGIASRFFIFTTTIRRGNTGHPARSPTRPDRWHSLSRLCPKSASSPSNEQPNIETGGDRNGR